MIDEKDTTPADKDGKYEFMIHYSGRELPCTVLKEQDKFIVYIEDNITSELTLGPDGTLMQTGGTDLADSAVEFIKKRILG
ncbi:hypothetical protein [Mucilaginibacter psychrotolerans]|uniref:Uncharacterized protein n=1 Tax=Mucilaginibacter psychrotolerans TaxID=1524096 RepID=A0A4Y8S769_9SPHI|nr:hypothetical protein [Mucilaginibacter psychrotolerans]TFF34224.1 hypothetical protein E2R66_22835 [Mucilaginibacter psychrotolerans]